MGGSSICSQFLLKHKIAQGHLDKSQPLALPSRRWKLPYHILWDYASLQITPSHMQGNSQPLPIPVKRSELDPLTMTRRLCSFSLHSNFCLLKIHIPIKRTLNFPPSLFPLTLPGDPCERQQHLAVPNQRDHGGTVSKMIGSSADSKINFSH